MVSTEQLQQLERLARFGGKYVVLDRSTLAELVDELIAMRTARSMFLEQSGRK